MAQEFRARPDGTPYPITPKKRSWGGPLLFVAAAAAIAAGGGAVGAAGGLGAAGGGVSAAPGGSLPGNLAGDVADSLPGRDLATRHIEARRSARAGRSQEAWSRLALKQLTRQVEHRIGRDLDCVASSSGAVRAFLLRTPCTSLDRVLLTVGDGHGNAAVVSVVRVGFRTTAQAMAFQQVEDQPGSGDVRPLDIAAVLGLTNVRMTAQHYRSRLDGSAVVVAEAETATGRIPGPTLDAIADVASYLPVT